MQVKCFYLILSLFILHYHCNYITVNTNLGSIMGVFEDNLYKFRGIPYANPPINNLRWQPPQMINSWEPSVLNATEFKAACPQIYYPPSRDPFITVPISEDCLQLNIFTPSILSNSSLPVMVYIHGGSFYSGWGGDAIFWGDFIANYTKDTILVTINYRLGALGFLVSEDITGNFGILDQQLALHWVQNNIESFGGNKDEVTLFGQSAGAMSVTLHLLSPLSFGLYKRTISESNPMGINYRTPEESYIYANKLASNLGCNINDLSCLYSQTWQDIIDAQQHTKSFFYPLNTTIVISFYPTIDGTIIPYQPIEMIKDMNFNPNVESVIFGSNRNDSLTFIPSGYISYAEYESLVTLFFGIINSTKVLNQYPPVPGADNFNLLSIAATDWLFNCPNRLASRVFNEANIQSYAYNFMHIPSNTPFYRNSADKIKCENAVCHSDELIYVFHSSEFVNATYTVEETEFSYNILKYWTNYAHGTVIQNNNNLPNWPKYTNTNESLNLNIPITILTNYNQENCDFWDSLGYYN